MLIFAYLQKQKPGVQVKPHLGNQLRLQSGRRTLSSTSSPLPKQPKWFTVYRVFSSPVHEPLSWLCLQKVGAVPQAQVHGSVSERRGKLMLQQNDMTADVLSSAESISGILTAETEMYLMVPPSYAWWLDLDHKRKSPDSKCRGIPSLYIHHVHLQAHPGKRHRMLESVLALLWLFLSQKT